MIAAGDAPAFSLDPLGAFAYGGDADKTAAGLASLVVPHIDDPADSWYPNYKYLARHLTIGLLLNEFMGGGTFESLLRRLQNPLLNSRDHVAILSLAAPRIAEDFRGFTSDQYEGVFATARGYLGPLADPSVIALFREGEPFATILAASPMEFVVDESSAGAAKVHVDQLYAVRRIMVGSLAMASANEWPHSV